MENQSQIEAKIQKYGFDILNSPSMDAERGFIQHGQTSVYAHSVAVAAMCLYIAAVFNIKADESALVRGALLHDYCLYDWHIPDNSHKLHGFTHARTALKNACRDFEIGEIEKDMIKKHMFPLNIAPPVYKESVILCIADKICAARETAFWLFCKLKKTERMLF